MEAELNPLCVQGLNPYHKTNALEKEKKAKKLEGREQIHFFVVLKRFQLDSEGKSKDD